MFEESRKSKSRTLQWDEETIAEHDKLRGTRQKIEEPPTPYAYNDNDAYNSDSSDSNMKMAIGTPPLSSSPTGLHPRDSLINNWENFQAKLNYQLYLQDNQEKIDNDSNSKSIFTFNDNYENDEITEDTNTEKDNNDFKSKRNSHYNEFKIMQAMKLKMKSQMNDEDEDFEEDDEINDNSNNKIIEEE